MDKAQNQPRDTYVSDDIERANRNAFLIRCGIGISVSYLLLYTVIGFIQMGYYSAIFVLTYIVLSRWTGPSSDHARGTVLMGAATVQLSGICIIFAAPESGTHYYLMLIPILSLFSISPKRRLWWWLFTIASTGLLLWIELKRDVFQPLIPYDKAIEATFPYWRASSALVTVALIVATFRNFYKVVRTTREDLKSSYDNVQRLLVEVEAANEAKSRFLAQLSHELRTPLNGILGTSEAMMEGIYGPLTTAQEKALGTVDRAANHQLLLVNDLLDMAKIEQESFEPIMEAVSLDTISTDVLELLRDKAVQSDVIFQFQSPPEPVFVVTDNRRIRQMLLNLVGNAIKFTPEGGQVTLRIEVQEDWISLAVQDTGIGIAPEELPRMFEAFTQVDSTQQRKHAGTGLGLNLTATLAQVLGGELTAESTLGQGSTFTIKLPNKAPSQGDIEALKELHTSTDLFAPEVKAVETEAKDLHEPAPPTKQVEASAELQPSEPADPDSLHVLLVDDTPANIGHLRDFLLSKGHRVSTASNGLEAIEQAQARPDIVFMDVQMPDMDGLEAIRRLRADAHTKDLHIVSLTSFAMGEDRDRCLKAGADDYESKPVSLRRVLEMVEARKTQ